MERPYRDIRDRDGPRPIKVTSSNTDLWILLAVTVIILVIAWGIMLYYSIDSIPSIESTGNGVLVDCPPGQCATNAFNGEKRCPQPTGTITSNANIEVCSSQYSCDNPGYPYAIQSDNSTSQSGNCEEDVACRCVSQMQCADYISSYFQTINGNPYTGLDGQRTMFEQLDTSTNVLTDETSTNSPFQLTNPNTQFCTVPLLWLYRSTPGCSGIESIAECMNGLNGCNDRPVYNPCLRGTLAFISNDSGSFDRSLIDRLPLACVDGEPPPVCGQVAIYDTNYKRLVYQNLPDFV